MKKIILFFEKHTTFFNLFSLLVVMYGFLYVIKPTTSIVYLYEWLLIGPEPVVFFAIIMALMGKITADLLHGLFYSKSTNHKESEKGKVVLGVIFKKMYGITPLVLSLFWVMIFGNFSVSGNLIVRSLGTFLFAFLFCSSVSYITSFLIIFFKRESTEIVIQTTDVSRKRNKEYGYGMFPDTHEPGIPFEGEEKERNEQSFKRRISV